MDDLSITYSIDSLKILGKVVKIQKEYIKSKPFIQKIKDIYDKKKISYLLETVF